MKQNEVVMDGHANHPVIESAVPLIESNHGSWNSISRWICASGVADSCFIRYAGTR
jgi:hypothetical protein